MAKDDRRPNAGTTRKPVDEQVADDLRRAPLDIPDSDVGSPLWVRATRWLISLIAVWIAHRFELAVAFWKSLPLGVRQFITDLVTFLLNLFT